MVSFIVYTYRGEKMDDQELIRGIKVNNSFCLNLLIEKYISYITSVIAHVGKNYLTRQDIEEISADAFTSLWEYKDEFVLEGKSVKSYLAAIARNRVKNVLCMRKIKLLPLEEDLIDSELYVEEIVANRQMYEQINDIVNEMQEPDKEIFIRRYFYYEKTSQIAKELSINKKTIETRILRGREKLRKIILERGVL
jgi:RNA polymerase sigma-70 factor (ECF subfamily)